MPAELLVASGIFAVVLLALLARRSGSDDDVGSDPAALGKRYIDVKIEKHIDALAARYAERTAASGREDPERFRPEIESFIALVLERDLDESEDAELRDSVREVLVLQREYVYDRVLACIKAHPLDA